jgi:hypothetical protein
MMIVACVVLIVVIGLIEGNGTVGGGPSSDS